MIVTHRGSCALLLLLLVHTQTAVAAPTAQMTVVSAKSSVELGVWERGHLRMYLEQNGLGCQLTMKKQTLRGELQLRLDVDGEKPVRATIVDAKKLSPAAFAPCLVRILKNVQLHKLAPHFTWEGTLRYDSLSPYEVNVQSLYGRMYELTMRNIIVAALEQPADCMQRFFTDPREISVVLLASFDVDEAGKLRNLEVKESTAGENGIDACVKSQIAPLSFPPGTLKGAKLRIALLRPTTKPPDADTPVLMLKSDK